MINVDENIISITDNNNQVLQFMTDGNGDYYFTLISPLENQECYLFEIDNSQSIYKTLKSFVEHEINYTNNKTNPYFISNGNSIKISDQNKPITESEYVEFSLLDDKIEIVFSKKFPISIRITAVGRMDSYPFFIPVIDLFNDIENIETKNKFITYAETDRIQELGGFADNPTDIDGDFEAYNVCTAEEYISAMKAEDFISLGELSYPLLEKICAWSKEISEYDILNGTFMTNNKRSFIEAITKTHAYKAGVAYLHTNNPKFLAMMVAYSNFEGLDRYLSYESHQNLNNDEYYKYLENILTELNTIYESSNAKQRIILLKRVLKIISRIKIPSDFNTLKIPNNKLVKHLTMFKQNKNI